ncbi:Mobilization protein BmgB [Mucinivorans hirudinis]|uniref:Mobilization protein BmgB n=1 Tax=Mucinivorans hirudinis TaxID=1433126 RepID=A0A060R6T6_9BACT|nr:Mobilization protein BmgB [Mucinivorans hirudinis]
MRTIKNRNENGRPKLASTEVRKYRIEVRFATEEYFLLKTKARTARLTISDFIRTTLRNSTVKERLTATHLQLITKLTGMANNLNQIAKRANQAGYFAAKTESETLAKEIDNVIKSIENDG